MSQPQKHHYIPVFYLKQWAGPHGRVVEYSRPWKAVKPRRTHPDGTGYERNLYAIKGAASARTHEVETEFMKGFDDIASRALKLMHENADVELPPKIAAGWARFLVSLLLRNPENIAKIHALFHKNVAEQSEKIKKTYAEDRSPDEPPTFEEFEALARKEFFPVGEAWALPMFLDGSDAAKAIYGMSWIARPFGDRSYKLLTSDRPVILNTGFVNIRNFLMLPLGPRRLFVAAKDSADLPKITRLPDDILARTVNEIMASQAQKYVYGADDSQLRFVEARLEKGLAKTFTVRDVEHAPA